FFVYPEAEMRQSTNNQTHHDFAVTVNECLEVHERAPTAADKARVTATPIITTLFVVARSALSVRRPIDSHADIRRHMFAATSNPPDMTYGNACPVNLAKCSGAKNSTIAAYIAAPA
ncbi:MAG: hypothetical protein ABJ294_17160, partial [Parasphingorhabdus sp.]|uniref:hypothetical protein n=1 Tax=Parasphingorhabdus sp. TaxID=2709688 RepID=UPI0032979AD7